MRNLKLLGSVCCCLALGCSSRPSNHRLEKKVLPVVSDRSSIATTGIYRDWDGDLPSLLGDNGIHYGNGLVMGTNPDLSNPPTVYYIWYGDWEGNSAVSILEDLANSIAPITSGGIFGSAYFNINTTYYDLSRNYVNNYVVFGGNYFDRYSLGTTLSDAAVLAIVANAINRGFFPLDFNGVYFVLTSQDVHESSGFCTRYCGWHSYAYLSSTWIKYAFVGNGARCLNACAAQRIRSPNDNLGADAMANVIGHELEETVTDPLPWSGWADERNQENADKCAWTFEPTYTAPNGSLYNMELVNDDLGIDRLFHIQRN